MPDSTAERGVITIVTVCRNSAHTIGRTIESVLAQKEAWVEYLIVDGASTDGTQDVVRSYGSAIDLFLSEPDLGIADAFNKGIERARGSVIGLINSDDALLPGALRKVCDYLEAHAEVDVVHGDVMLFAGDTLVKKVRPAGRWWYPWRLVLFNHPATFVRRKLYRRLGGFDIAYRIAMDVEIFLRWMASGATIAYLPEPLVRMESGGVSGRQALLGYREVKQALAHHGFSRFLANLQFLARFGVQMLVEVQAGMRLLRRR